MAKRKVVSQTSNLVEEKDKKVIFEVDGTKIKSDTVYLIGNRYDPESPVIDENQKFKKIDSRVVYETCTMNFVPNNRYDSSVGRFDTGFYPQSPMYSGKDAKVVAEQVKNLNTAIVKPIEGMKGEDGLLDANHTEYWDDHCVELFSNQIIETSNPEQLLILWTALVSKSIAPAGPNGNAPRYKMANYVLHERNTAINAGTEGKANTLDAITEFGIIYKQSPDLAKAVCVYLQIAAASRSTDEGNLKAAVMQWVSETPERPAKLFKLCTDVAGKGNTKDVVQVYYRLAILASMRHITKVDGDFRFEGNSLGTSLKSAATNLTEDKNLEEMLVRIEDLFTAKTLDLD